MITLTFYDNDEAMSMRFNLLQRGYEEFESDTELSTGSFEEWTGETESGEFACGFYVEPFENETLFSEII